MRLLISTQKYGVVHCQTQAGDIKTNHKVKLNFCLPEFIVEEIVTWYFNVYDYSEIRYDMIKWIYLQI